MIVVAELRSVEPIPGKDKVKEISVRIDESGTTKQIVTNAPNVLAEKIGQHLVVALEGAELPGMEAVKRTNISGRVSEGVVCDSRMLNWSGGGAGVAVFLGDDAEVGSLPPADRPRPNAAKPEACGPVTDGLFKKKPSKEEKKKAARAAREVRKASKVAVASNAAAISNSAALHDTTVDSDTVKRS